MIEWSEQHLMIRDMVRRFVEAEIKPQARGARARRHAALRHPAQDDADVRHRRDGAHALRAADRAREGRGARGEAPAAAHARAATATTSAHAAHPDHRAVPLLPGHGDGDGRQRRASPPRAIMSQGHDRAEGALGARRCSRSTRSAPGRSPSPARAPTPSADEVDRAPRRRRLRAERQQDLHHQRPLRRHHRLHLQARRRAATPKRAQGPQLRPRQAACPASRSRSRCARWACTRRRPASCSSRTCASARTACSARPRTRRRRSGAKETFTDGAHRRRRDGARHRRAVPRALASTTRSTRVQFGQPDRRVPAHPAEAREDGGRAHEHPEPGVPPDRAGGRRASR